MHLRCPHCRYEFSDNTGLLLSDVVCPKCGKAFHLHPAEPASTEPRPPQPESAEQTDGFHSTQHRSYVVASAGTIIANRYHLLQHIADGGMGSVWMAEQRAPMKKRVAIKLVKPGLASKDMLARFEAERQALALMDHPNIAQALDGGSTDDGQPFFVMEYVKGIPLTEYCDERRLPIRARLELFIQICQAVQHAHQKAIIHRDLKPSNILVAEHGDKPLLKVIDFGLAKALQGSHVLTDRTMFTVLGSMVGTPPYMAPEQFGVNALDVDTRTDIYALGAILYELLSSSTPISDRQFREQSWEDIRRIVRCEEPQRPSLRLSTSEQLPQIAANRQSAPEKLLKSVRGDLDCIVLKALEKERVHRFASADAMADELRRHLDGQPIQTRLTTRTERAWRWCRRNALVASLSAAVLLLLVIGALVSTSFALLATHRNAELAQAVQREQSQRELAEKQRSLAEDNLEIAVNTVDDFFYRVANDARFKQPGLESLRNRLLDATAAFYVHFAEKSEGNLSRESNLAGMVVNLAYAEEDSGNRNKALQTYDQAISIWERICSQAPDNVKYRRGLVSAHFAVDYFFLRDPNIAQHEEMSVDWAQALKHLTQTVDLCAKLAADFPDDVELGLALPRAEAMLGVLLEAHGKKEEALAQFKLAAESEERLNARSRKDQSLIDGLADIHNSIAWDIVVTPQASLSPEAVQLAIKLAQQAFDAEPQDGNIANTLGVVYYRTGNWSKAIDVLRRARELNGLHLVSSDGYFLAMAMAKLGRDDEAQRWFQASDRWLAAYELDKKEELAFRSEAAAELKITAEPLKAVDKTPDEIAAIAKLLIDADPTAPGNDRLQAEVAKVKSPKVVASAASGSPAATPSTDVSTVASSQTTLSTPATTSPQPNSSAADDDKTAPVQLDVGLIGYWNFEDGAGDTVADRTGHKLDGHLKGDNVEKCWSTDAPAVPQNHTALKLDGTTQFVEIDDDPRLRFDKELAISVWVNTLRPLPHFDRVLEKSITDGGYCIKLDDSGHAVFQINVVPGTLRNAKSKLPINDGRWHHIVCMCGNQKVCMYVDGEMNEEKSVQELKASTGAGELTIGRSSSKRDAQTGGLFYRGEVDELRMYNRLLNPAEIRKLAGQ
ncbi:MAG TPA: protein kinase [Pirellulales bacterium]|nr:protein kinase [Pirellulales bacterium]